MQLGKAEPLSVLQEHHRRVRDVYPDLDDYGRDQDIYLPFLKSSHHPLFFLQVHPPMEQAQPVIRKYIARQSLVHCGGRSRAFHAGFIYHGADDICLAALHYFIPDEIIHPLPLSLIDPVCDRWPSPFWKFPYYRDIEIAVDGERERSGYRGS